MPEACGVCSSQKGDHLLSAPSYFPPKELLALTLLNVYILGVLDELEQKKLSRVVAAG